MPPACWFEHFLPGPTAKRTIIRSVLAGSAPHTPRQPPHARHVIPHTPHHPPHTRHVIYLVPRHPPHTRHVIHHTTRHPLHARHVIPHTPRHPLPRGEQSSAALAWPDPHRVARPPGRRVIENKDSRRHWSKIYFHGECSYIRVDSARRFDAGRVLVLNKPPGGGGG